MSLPEPLPSEGALEISKVERDYAGYAHLSTLLSMVGIPSFVGPLVIYLLKKDESPYVAFHALQALIFHGAATILAVLVGIAMIPLLFVLVGFLLVPVIGLLVYGPVVWSTIGGIQVMGGKDFEYPIAADYARRWSQPTA